MKDDYGQDGSWNPARSRRTNGSSDDAQPEGGHEHDKVILTADDMRRAISRIAHEIVERNAGASDLLLVGLRTRGGPLSARLAARIGELEQTRVLTCTLDTTPYRDDRPRRRALPLPLPAPLPVEVDGRVVVLVDDVLFTGRTARAALDALLHQGRPRKVQLAVLVDRGHRELPIRADYVGKNVPTALGESIRVRLRETDGTDAVVLRSAPAGGARG